MCTKNCKTNSNSVLQVFLSKKITSMVDFILKLKFQFSIVEQSECNKF